MEEKNEENTSYFNSNFVRFKPDCFEWCRGYGGHDDSEGGL